MPEKLTEAESRAARTMKYGSNVIISILLLGVILVTANWFAGRMQKRVDLTLNKQYTISDATIKLLKTLKDTVTVTVYATEQDTPPEWTEQRRQFRDLLYEYRLRSGRRVNYTFKDPSSDPKVEEEAKRDNIRPQEMQQASQTELKLKVGYLGFKVEYKGKQEVSPFIRPESSLEYQLTRAINKVAEVNIPTIGVMSPPGNPMMGREGQFSLVEDILDKEGFKVKKVSASNLNDLKDVQMLMIFDPEELSEEALFRIDQYVMNGGRLFVAAPGVQMSQRGEMSRATPKAPNINSILEHYGLKVEENLLEDWGRGLPQQAITYSGQFVRYTNPFLMQVTDISKSNSITKRLPGLFLPFPSEVGLSSQGTSGTIEVLASTSGKTRVQKEMFNLEVPKLKKPKEDEDLSTRSLIVSVKGKLKSRFASLPPPTLTKDDGSTYSVPASDVVTESKGEAQVIVAGTALPFSDPAIQRFEPNLIFPVNVAEALTRGGDILSLRGKDMILASLREGITEQQALTTQVLVIGGMPILLIALGFLKLALNRARRARYRVLYAPKN